MTGRSTAIAAVTAFFLITSAAAQPGSPKPAPNSQAESKPVPVPTVLAAASAVQMPAPQKADEAPPAPKKRNARVTTCRCGE